MGGGFDCHFFEDFSRQWAGAGWWSGRVSTIEPLVEFGDHVLRCLEALPDGVLIIGVDGSDEFRREAEIGRVGTDGFLAPVAMHFQASFGSSAVFAVFHK